MIRVSILGATGYTGMELARILLRHSRVKLTSLTSRQDEPPAIETLVPEISRTSALKLQKFDFKTVADTSDVIFCCLPHTEAAEICAQFYKAGKIVIDLSADFRLKDPKLYKTWYKHEHPKKELLKQAVYGSPELYREAIRKANLIANPGCYPTSVILALKPLLDGNLIDPLDITIDSKSGISGAGKKMTQATFFGEVNENFKAYKVNQHQHMPEIQSVLETSTGKKLDITFVPHLLPIDRGILSTLYLRKKKGVRNAQIAEAFRKKYVSEPFVRLKQQGEFPSLRDVQHTNYCDIGIWTGEGTDRVIVISAIDNLIKGASGQAVQNMNIRCGFPETTGLELG